jgi:hypothetical protein
LALVPDDDWEAASTAATNGSLKASRKMNMSFELLCNFPLLSGPVLNWCNALRSIHVPLKKMPPGLAHYARCHSLTNQSIVSSPPVIQITSQCSSRPAMDQCLRVT